MLAYYAGQDLANSTSYQVLSAVAGNGNDEGVSGFIYLFSPSSTTHVKHFICQTQYIGPDGGGNPYCKLDRITGFADTTSAVDAINFQFASDNIDDGKIKLFGLKDS